MTRKVKINPASRKSKAKRQAKGQVPVRPTRKQLEKLAIASTPFSHVGGRIGAGLGSIFGSPAIGQGIGSWLGSGIGKIFGSGAYKMQQNSIWSTSDQCPSMHSTSESVILRHREYISDVNSSTGFVVTEYPINAGLTSTFPFLSTIAANFQEYTFRGLVFEFKSTSADALNSTNTALGTVAMAVQYRAGAASFTNKQQVLNEMWSADAKPANSFFMPVECAPSECPIDIQYVRTGALSTDDDIKFYDLGKLSVATIGSQATAVVGELWASYEVCLRKPILGGATGINIQSVGLYRSGVDGTHPLGTDTLEASCNSLGIVITNGTTLNFPTGCDSKYCLTITWVGGLGAWTATNFNVTSNISFQTRNGLSWVSLGTSSSINYATITADFYVTDPTKVASITVSSMTMTTPAYAYVDISPIDFDSIAT